MATLASEGPTASTQGLQYFFHVLSFLIFQNFGTLPLGTVCHDWQVLIADYKPFHYSFPWVYEIERVFSSAGHWESLVPEHKNTVHRYQNRKFCIFLGNDISFFSPPSFIHLVIVKIFMHMCMSPVCERSQIGGWQFFSVSPGCYSCVASLWREILGSPPEPISGKGRCSVIARQQSNALTWIVSKSLPTRSTVYVLRNPHALPWLSMWLLWTCDPLTS